MGSESKNRNGDGCGGEGGEATAAHGVPAVAKKVVQRVKEIVNCTEQEIYAVLKECDMDPNRAVEKLIAQDTFHEVRSKRERRKEMKEALDSRTRGNNLGLIRGGKTGTCCDRSVVHGGLTHVTYNEHGKAVDNGEVGLKCPLDTFSTTHVVGKNTKSDSLSTDNGRQAFRTGDSMSDSAQVSSGPQSSLIGVSKGHLSMADVVRMGTTSQVAVSHNHYNTSQVSTDGNSESSLSLHCQKHSEQPVFHDEWPVIEQPITGNSHALNMSASSNSNELFKHPNLHDTAVSLCMNRELDAAQVSRGNVAIESASIHNVTSSNTGLGSQSNSNLKNSCSSDFHSSCEHHDDVSSTASDFHRLSIRESKLEEPSSEDSPTVVLPNHLLALAANCSHLSFGSYNGGRNSASSAIFASNHISRSGLEEKSAAVDGSSAQFLDASALYPGDKQLGFDAFRGTADYENHDILSSPPQELEKYIVPEETLGHDYNTMVSASVPLKKPDLLIGNHSNFPRELHADSNSIPGDLLAFLMSQSQPAIYNNAVSSIRNPAISMSEVMEPGAFALPNRSALPQDLTVKSSLHFQQLPDTEGYGSLPQNQSYMTTTNSPQTFSGNNAYNQSHVDMKYNIAQNRNELLMSRFPPATARDAFGYENLGSSFYRPGNFLSNPSLGGYMMPSSSFDQILPSQYNGGRNLSSIQEHGSFSQWDYGAESRSSLPERTRDNILGQPSQASLSQYTSRGYSDLYPSRTQNLEELQPSGSFQDLSSKQLHQFWKHNH
ncbi:uncharacterized protein LOC133294920 [Gastrolobium bilobum]|uniref:uncharacterized protein LOC133294920 n=1 Tax=Gastrolobium bilobum TaxID=150636 RepID=UPI002AB27DBF|nr:uncharacterized protein LOC133294920 [Gastrolobium bilobum]